MRFETTRVDEAIEVIAPDGSAVRPLCTLPGVASFAQFELAPGQVSRAVSHATVEEIWFVIGGSGEIWRARGIRGVEAGDAGGGGGDAEALGARGADPEALGAGAHSEGVGDADAHSAGKAAHGGRDADAHSAGEAAHGGGANGGGAGADGAHGAWTQDTQDTQDTQEETTYLAPGVCLTIPLGTSFQFRAGADGLRVVAVTAPPWPDAPDEARLGQGPW